MNKQNDKQTAALKLANQYAEQYHLLTNQLSIVKQENKDLRANLQINKDIIQGFFQKTVLDDKVNFFIAKIKEENRFITTKLSMKEKEAKESQSKLTSIEQVSNTHIMTLKDEIEQLKTKTFLLENILIEKDNIILNYNKKHKKHQGDSSNEKIIEVFIANPSEVVNKLTDRLELYMQINQKLGIHIQNLKKIMSKNDKKIIDNDAEISKLKQELAGYRVQKKNSSIIEQLNQNNNNNNNNSFSRPYTSFNNSDNFLFGSSLSKMNKSANTITYDNISNDHYMSRSRRTAFKHIEKLEECNKTKQLNKQFFDLTEEWYETLKHCAMTQDEYVKYCKNKNMTKLTDVIEYLYKLIIDKNMQVKMLDDENDCLNWENIKLNKMNIELSDEIDLLKTGENSTMINSHWRKGGDLSTFVNVDEKNREENIGLSYGSYVKDSMTSSEFREGMVLDQFDLTSEMSKKIAFCDGGINKDEEPVNLMIAKKG